MDEFTEFAGEGDWHFEHITPDLVQAERRSRVLFEGRTKFQKVVVQDGAAFGRSLVLDDKTQSTEFDEFVYHESLVHPVMIAHANPRTVFVAGGGEGATIREVLVHRTVEKVVMVDIDEQVVELCRLHLVNHHRGSFEDKRLELIHDDALAYLDRSDELFDVVVIDVPDPLEAGPAYLLYTQEFYELVRERLNPNGLIVAQSGPTGPTFYEQCFSVVAHTIGSVFPTTAVYEAFVPSFGSTWGFVIGSLGESPDYLTSNEVDRRVTERITTELRHYDGITHHGMFSVPKYLRAALQAEDRIITNANPLFVT